MLKNKHLYIYVVIILVLFIAYFTLSKYQKRYNVLHISSYHPDYSWDMDMEKGVNDVFRKNHINYNYRVFYLNTKQHQDNEWVKERVNKAVNLIKASNPDVIFVSDDNATKFVAGKLKNTKYKFVFLGVNNEPGAYGMPTVNITGVIERHLFKENVMLLKLLDPDIKEIAVLTDNSETSKIMIEQFKEIMPDLPVKVIGIHKTNSFKEWKGLVNFYKNKADAFLIILYLTLKDDYNYKVYQKDVIRWTVNNSKIPIVGPFSFLVDDGGLASVAITGYGQGYLAAEKAMKILEGVSPKDIKVEKTSHSVIYVNKKRAKSLHIKIPNKIPFKLVGSSELIEKK